MIYLQLFLSFLQVGMFSIGGGYAAMPLIQSQVVEKYAWLTMNEFTDLITIAEMTPTPIAKRIAMFSIRADPAFTKKNPIKFFIPSTSPPCIVAGHK